MMKEMIMIIYIDNVTKLLNKSDELLNDEVSNGTDLKSINFVLNNIDRENDGRLIIPITLNDKKSHNLAKIKQSYV